jgi:hypothetical protein
VLGRSNMGAGGGGGGALEPPTLQISGGPQSTLFNFFAVLDQGVEEDKGL